MTQSSKVKLGKRLATIQALVGDGYDHIWDCCCDHGLLGFQLLEHGKAEQLHFVDIVPQLLLQIEQKLSRFYRGEKRWKVHCIDVADLPLGDYKDQKHLLIIAGVGGPLMIDFLRKLLPLSRGMNVEFIVSPVHHNYQLRAFLNEADCGLLDELIVAENKRFYEVLHFTNTSGTKVSLTGDKMWDLEDLSHECYLQQTIEHYQRMDKNPKTDVAEIIADYQKIGIDS